MINKYEFIERIPDICYSLEDCWCCALIAICTYYNIDYAPILINSGFFYQHKIKNNNKITFDNIISNSVSIAQTGENSFDMIGDMSLIESERVFLQNFLGLEGKFTFTDNDTKGENLIIDNIKKGIPIIAWIDTYVCPWNNMYGKYHFPHCFVIFDCDGEYCDIFDSLYQKSIAQIKFEIIKNRVYYTNCFTMNEKKIDFSNLKLNDLWKILSDVYYKGESIFAVYEKNISMFVNDIKQCDTLYNDDINEEDEKIKLLMRIFVNNHQKVKQAYEVLKNNFEITNDIDSIIQQDIKCWKVAGTLLIKICFLPKEMRESRLNNLYEYLDLLITNALKKKEYYIKFC